FKKYFEKTDMGLVRFLLGKEFYGSSSFELKSESEKTLFSTLEFLRKLTAKNPLILRLEDLQWVDSASVQMLHFLARNIEGLRLLLIGTYRPEELISEVSDIAHPLLESLRIMRREAVCQEICLDILNADELKLAIEGMLGPIDAGLLRRIVSESGGIPLFAVETVRLLFETGVLIQKGGKWCDYKEAQVSIPSTVKEVILRRLERLSKDERRIMECAAVIGEHFETDVIEEVLKTDRLKLIEELESSERDHQLITALEGGFRFNHEIVRKVAYEQLSSTHRRELHRVIGTVLENRKPDESAYGALSVHFHMAGQSDKSLKYSLLAGESCTMKLAMIEAIPYFQRALEAAGNDKKYTNEKLHALEGLGDANVGLYNYTSAIKFYEAFLELSSDKKLNVSILRKSAWCWRPDALGKGNLLKAMELLKKAEDCGEVELKERGEILNVYSMLSFQEGNFDETDRYQSEAEQIFEKIGLNERLAMLLVDHASINLCQGRVVEALDKISRATQIHAKSPSPSGELDVLTTLGLTYFHQGLFEKSLEYYNKVINLATQIGEYGHLHGAFVDRVLIYDSIGDHESAKEQALKSLEIAKNIESEYMLLGSCALLTHTLIHLDRIQDAEKYCNESQELAKNFEWRVKTFFRGFIQIVQGELLAANKEWNLSAEKFRNGIELIRSGMWGILYEALARSWFGESLLKQGLKAEAKLQYQTALQLYKRLENNTQSQRVTQLIKTLC
ncbi:MAG: hypothetical protein LUQ00_03260, partial [Candidatus Methanomethyliaceae archaeon]|nr:hypothetical protein [Candidatus Methanomethyliaceae archaeon]